MGLFADQGLDQNTTMDLKFGFTLEELFAPDAKPIPDFVLGGFTLKQEFNLWNGIHKVIMNLFNEMKQGDMKSAMLLKLFAPALPFYLLKINGKVDIELDPEDTKIIFDQPEAQMAAVNMHDLLVNMSPWGTINDMELINCDDEDGS